MKNSIWTILIVLTAIPSVKAQEALKPSFFIGGYYTFLVDPVILESTLDTINLRHHYINMNIRYALSYKWRIGAEYILVIMSPQEIKDPFYILGLTADYDLLRARRSKLHLRLGLSLSNLSFAGEFEPKRRTVFNRIIGASYEFRITKVVWIYAGYYNHYPFNKIPYKYSVAQPFIGVCVGI